MRRKRTLEPQGSVEQKHRSSALAEMLGNATICTMHHANRTKQQTCMGVVNGRHEGQLRKKLEVVYVKPPYFNLKK
jgi:hypothetical protein